MMRRFASLFLLASISQGCSSESAEEEAQATQPQGEDPVKTEAKSIEEAADEAAKLVEEDAKAEIDAAKAAQAENSQ